MIEVVESRVVSLTRSGSERLPDTSTPDAARRGGVELVLQLRPSAGVVAGAHDGQDGDKTDRGGQAREASPDGWLGDAAHGHDAQGERVQPQSATAVGAGAADAAAPERPGELPRARSAQRHGIPDDPVGRFALARSPVVHGSHAVDDRISVLQTALRAAARRRAEQDLLRPKNLVMALTAGVAELAVRYAWTPADDDATLRRDIEVHELVTDAFADLLRLADEVGVDLAGELQRLHTGRSVSPSETLA